MLFAGDDVLVEELLCLVGSPYLSSFPATVWAGSACSGVSSSAYQWRGVLRSRTRGQGGLFGGGGGWRLQWWCTVGVSVVVLRRRVVSLASP